MKRKLACLIGLTTLLVCVASAQEVRVVQTTPDLGQAMTPQPAVRFTAATPSPLQIEVDDDARFQEIDGFGASLTDSSAWLLQTKLDEAQRSRAMKELFDPAEGIGLSFLRQPMGASDLALRHYSYDDGAADPALQHFSVQHDEPYILPLLRQARELNPQLKVMASPWSSPGWMKSSGSMVGGSLKPADYQALADYFVRFIRTYESKGVPIYAVTMQNEPLYVPKDYPGTDMDAAAQTAFLRDYLGPAFRKAKLETKVMVYDHNWDHPEYPISVLSDATASKYAAGTAFHCYGGEVEAQSEVHKKFPEKDIWETECSGGTWQKGNVLAMEAQLIIGTTRNWARSVVLWGLALDQDHGPNAGGCDTCRGLITVHTQRGTRFTRTLDYYVMGQVSKFVRPGAHRIDSTSFDGKLEDVAFRNQDGSLVVFALNPGTESKSFQVRYKGRAFSYVLPAGSVATFAWKPDSAILQGAQ